MILICFVLYSFNPNLSMCSQRGDSQHNCCAGPAHHLPEGKTEICCSKPSTISNGLPFKQNYHWMINADLELCFVCGMIMYFAVIAENDL